MTEDEIGSIRSDLQNLETMLAGRLATIESMIATEPQRCPFREIISKAANNATRIGTLEILVTNIRLDAAKAGAAGGGIVAAIMTVLFVISKIQGWL
jgi:hypothetical protein